MKISVITITMGRSDLTIQTLERFYKDNMPYKHYIFDNGSPQEDLDKVVAFFKERPDVNSMIFKSPENIGIAKALHSCIDFAIVNNEEPDIFLKLDNDIEIVSTDLLKRVSEFYTRFGQMFVVAPRDITIDPAYSPKEFYTRDLAEKKKTTFTATTHVGGACLFIPIKAAKVLSGSKVEKDVGRGRKLRSKGYKVGYLDYLQIKHLGLNQSISYDKYKF